ncbi:MAG: 23S rRNA (adenine(2503)-C(2))-methyltransferase RlmN [Deltaproteobacteria bacterium]|jgi:23S rRNA (adenine2503-C2)-methyltransferase|nr:23S rRNA (adenine(2503)-C(2))-methyltransferase RlmN [Deltaproteobacteria bacterium]
MLDILNLTYPELRNFVSITLGEKTFRADQVWQWLWKHGARSFDEMTNVSKAFRARLTDEAFIRWPEIVQERRSQDGTIKLLLRLGDGELIETVLIPSEGEPEETESCIISPLHSLRMTQCLSSQVGCAMGCTFCSTGELGFTRNLTQAEILGQILVARHLLGDTLKREILRNLVFMGMGEPLLNLTEVLRSLQTLNSELGLCFSARRITVSTCGIKDKLLDFGQSGLAYLALSLHATEQSLRAQIMPAAASWALPDLIKALEQYPLGNREKLTFEYLLLGGVNDSTEQARHLGQLAGQLKAKVNLIAYNPAAGSAYRAPEHEQVIAFEKTLWDMGVIAILRKSKGQDIEAACGQLRAKFMSSV